MSAMDCLPPYGTSVGRAFGLGESGAVQRLQWDTRDPLAAFEL